MLSNLLPPPLLYLHTPQRASTLHQAPQHRSLVPSSWLCHNTDAPNALHPTTHVTPTPLTGTATTRAQVPLLQQAEAEAMKLVLRAELLRQGLSHVGSLYRCTFGWLLRSLKLAEGPQQDASDPEAPKPSVLKHPPAIDEVVEMLEGQLLLDGVAPEWEVGGAGWACWLLASGCCTTWARYACAL